MSDNFTNNFFPTDEEMLTRLQNMKDAEQSAQLYESNIGSDPTVLNAFAEGISNLPENTMQYLSHAYHGGDLTKSRIPTIKEEDRKNARVYEELEGNDTATKVYGGLQSLPATGVGLGTAAAGAAAGAVFGPVGSFIGAGIGAALGSAIAYRATRDDYMRQAMNQFIQEHGREPNNIELELIMDRYDELATSSGLHEAGWEAVGNTAGVGILGKLGSKALAKTGIQGAKQIPLKVAGEQAMEVGTELPTQYFQDYNEYKGGMRETPPTWGEAFDEVLIPTLTVGAVTGGIGAGAHYIYNKYRKPQENAEEQQTNNQQQALPPAASEKLALPLGEADLPQNKERNRIINYANSIADTYRQQQGISPEYFKRNNADYRAMQILARDNPEYQPILDELDRKLMYSDEEITEQKYNAFMQKVNDSGLSVEDYLKQYPNEEKELIDIVSTPYGRQLYQQYQNTLANKQKQNNNSSDRVSRSNAIDVYLGMEDKANNTTQQNTDNEGRDYIDSFIQSNKPNPAVQHQQSHKLTVKDFIDNADASLNTQEALSKEEYNNIENDIKAYKKRYAMNKVATDRLNKLETRLQRHKRAYLHQGKQTPISQEETATQPISTENTIPVTEPTTKKEETPQQPEVATTATQPVETPSIEPNPVVTETTSTNDLLSNPVPQVSTNKKNKGKKEVDSSAIPSLSTATQTQEQVQQPVTQKKTTKANSTPKKNQKSNAEQLSLLSYTTTNVTDKQTTPESTPKQAPKQTSKQPIMQPQPLSIEQPKPVAQPIIEAKQQPVEAPKPTIVPSATSTQPVNNVQKPADVQSLSTANTQPQAVKEQQTTTKAKATTQTNTQKKQEPTAEEKKAAKQKKAIEEQSKKIDKIETNFNQKAQGPELIDGRFYNGQLTALQKIIDTPLSNENKERAQALYTKIDEHRKEQKRQIDEAKANNKTPKSIVQDRKKTVQEAKQNTKQVEETPTTSEVVNEVQPEQETTDNVETEEETPLTEEERTIIKAEKAEKAAEKAAVAKANTMIQSFPETVKKIISGEIQDTLPKDIEAALYKGNVEYTQEVQDAYFALKAYRKNKQDSQNNTQNKQDNKENDWQNNIYDVQNDYQYQSKPVQSKKTVSQEKSKEDINSEKNTDANLNISKTLNDILNKLRTLYDNLDKTTLTQVSNKKYTEQYNEYKQKNDELKSIIENNAKNEWFELSEKNKKDQREVTGLLGICQNLLKTKSPSQNISTKTQSTTQKDANPVQQNRMDFFKQRIVASVKTKIDELETEIKELLEVIDNNKDTYNVLESELDGIYTAIKDISDRLDTVKEETDKEDVNINIIQADIKEIRSDFNIIKDKIEILQKGDTNDTNSRSTSNDNINDIELEIPNSENNKENVNQSNNEEKESKQTPQKQEEQPKAVNKVEQQPVAEVQQPINKTKPETTIETIKEEAPVEQPVSETQKDNNTTNHKRIIVSTNNIQTNNEETTSSSDNVEEQQNKPPKKPRQPNKTTDKNNVKAIQSWLSGNKSHPLSERSLDTLEQLFEKGNEYLEQIIAIIKRGKIDNISNAVQTREDIKRFIPEIEEEIKTMSNPELDKIRENAKANIKKANKWFYDTQEKIESGLNLEELNKVIDEGNALTEQLLVIVDNDKKNRLSAFTEIARIQGLIKDVQKIIDAIQNKPIEQQIVELFGLRHVSPRPETIPQDKWNTFISEVKEAIKLFCKTIGISPMAFSINGSIQLRFQDVGDINNIMELGSYQTLPYRKENTIVRDVLLAVDNKLQLHSLAHEWMHSLDNWFQRKNSFERRGYAFSEIAKQIDNNKAPQDIHIDGVRDEVVQRMYDIIKVMKEQTEFMNKINSADFIEDDVKINEALARAFEAYMILKLDGKSKHITSFSTFDNNSELFKKQRLPNKTETNNMKKAFDEFFGELKQLEHKDDKGNVVSVELFSLSTNNEPHNGTNPSIVQRVVNTFKKAIKNFGYNVKILKSVDELPEHIKQAYSDKLNNIEGVYAGDTIYLIADNIRSEERAYEVMMHEVVAHGGLDSIMSEQEKNSTMDKLFHAIGGMANEQVAEIANKYGLDPKNNINDRVRVMEEYVAKLTEKRAKNHQFTQKEQSFWNKLVQAIKNILSRIYHKITNNQVESLIDRLEGHVFSGKVNTSMTPKNMMLSTKNIRLSLDNNTPYTTTNKVMDKVDAQRTKMREQASHIAGKVAGFVDNLANTEFAKRFDTVVDDAIVNEQHRQLSSFERKYGTAAYIAKKFPVAKKLFDIASNITKKSRTLAEEYAKMIPELYGNKEERLNEEQRGLLNDALFLFDEAVPNVRSHLIPIDKFKTNGRFANNCHRLDFDPNYQAKMNTLFDDIKNSKSQDVKNWYNTNKELIDKIANDKKVKSAFLNTRKALDKMWLDNNNMMAKNYRVNPDKHVKGDSKEAVAQRNRKIMANAKHFSQRMFYFPHVWNGKQSLNAYTPSGKLVVHLQFDKPMGMTIEQAATLAKQAYAKSKKVFNLDPSLVWKIEDNNIPEQERITNETKDTVTQYLRGFTDKIKNQNDRNVIQSLLMDVMDTSFTHLGFMAVHNRERQEIAGYQRENADKILFDYINGSARYNVKTQSALSMTELLSNINAYQDTELYNWANQYIKDIFHYYDNYEKIAQVSKTLAFCWYLGMNLKTATVNLTQNILLGVPILEKYANTKAIVPYFKNAWTTTSYLMAGKDKNKSKISQRDKDLIQWFIENNYDKGFMEELNEEFQNRLPNILNTIVKWMGLPMSITERFNRASLFLTAYKMADEGKIYDKYLQEYKVDNKTTKDEMCKAFALSVVSDAHFEFGKSNTPEILRSSNIGRLASPMMTFKAFTYNLLWTAVNQMQDIRNGGLQVLGKYMVASTILGGLTTFPLYSTFMQLWQATFGDDDDWTDKIRRNLPENELVRNMILYGAPTLAGVSIGGSLKTETPLANVHRAKTKVEAFENMLIETMGIPVDMVKKILKAKDVADDGGKTSRIIETLAPTFIANIMTTYRYIQEGGNRTVKGRLIGEDTMEGFQRYVKILGFQPVKNAVNYDKYKAQQGAKEYRSNKLDEITAMFQRKNFKEGNKEIAEWNKKYSREGKYFMKITRQDIERRIAARNRKEGTSERGKAEKRYFDIK